LSIQAVIAYEQDLPEHQKTGFVPHKKSACVSGVPEEKPLSWKH
jgi:hypothetical protein